LLSQSRFAVGRPAPPGALVHHVVVQERGGVDELHRRRQPQVMLALVAAEPRRRERQERPQPLAAGLDQMRRDLRDAGACSLAMQARISALTAAMSVASADWRLSTGVAACGRGFTLATRPARLLRLDSPP
jgi:hypothetical protein